MWELKRIVHHLSNQPIQGVQKIILDLCAFHVLQSEAINLIIGLFQECTEQDLDFEIINATEEVYKTLIYASLEFLEITHRS